MQIHVNKKNKKGIILIEAIVAMTVIVMIMTAIVTALISSINSTTYSEEQTIATGYAQEGIEIARNQKNIDWASITSLANRSYCLNIGDTLIDSGDAASCQRNIEGKYTRRIYVNQSGRDERPDGTREQKCFQNAIFVASTVTWSDARCTGVGDCHKVDLNSCFTNLNYIEAP